MNKTILKKTMDENNEVKNEDIEFYCGIIIFNRDKTQYLYPMIKEAINKELQKTILDPKVEYTKKYFGENYE